MAKVIDRRRHAFGGYNKRSLSRIKYIVRHCSATESGNTQAFERYWKGTLGWSSAGGYHYVILRDGTIQRNYNLNVITNGVKGYNTKSVHICLVGVDSFTSAQERAFMELYLDLKDELDLPVSRLKGHREFPRVYKSCPGIDMGVVRSAARRGEAVGGRRVASASTTKSSTPTYNGESFADFHSDWWMKKGNDVKEIQQLLNDLGYKAGKADGVFGQNTLDAVRKYQEANDISRNGGTYYGVPGPQTVRSLREVAKEHRSGLPSGILKRGDRGNEVRKVQQALTRVHFYPNKDAKNNGVDGIYGPNTENAVRRFQQVHVPHEVDGVYGPTTRKALTKALS